MAVSLREQKRRDEAWAAAKLEQRKRMTELQALEEQIEHMQGSLSLCTLTLRVYENQIRTGGRTFLANHWLA